MAEIWIWNSMARKRRSASDTFEENGIQIIKRFLDAKGHHVEIFDWATDKDYTDLSPFSLKVINRIVIEKLLKPKIGKPRKIILGSISLTLQKVLSGIQWFRLASRLKKLAVDSKKNNIKLLGIKVWYGEAFYWSKYLTRQIKKLNPECIVVAGGYHVSLYEEDILKHSDFDVAITHEGEYSLLKILELTDNYIKKGQSWQKSTLLEQFHQAAKNKQLPGLIYRDGDGIKYEKREEIEEQIATEKAIPLYSDNSGKTKIHILMESLGCPWGKCNFCVHNQFTAKYKTRRIDAILHEIEMVLKQGIGLFRFTGSDTTHTFGKTIADAILERGFKIEFTMGSRVVKNSMEPQTYTRIVESYCTMIQAGLRGVFIGGECGNDQINDKVMNKGINREEIIHTIKAIREAERKTNIHISISLAFIYPTPLIDGIDDEQIEAENLSLLAETRPDSAVISPPGAIKKSTWFEQKDRFGIELSEGYIEQFMEYEYVLYKPLESWPELGAHLNGKDFRQILSLSQKMQNSVERELGIPCNLCDEHFLMIRAADLKTKEEILTFKRNSLVSIVSSDYTYLQTISNKVNAYSKLLAAQNETILNQERLIN